MFERSVPRRVLRAAVAEAAARGDQRAGTEHVLLALLQQPLPFDRALLGRLNVPVAALRSALDEMDRAALAAVGVDLDVQLGENGPPAGEWPTRTRPAGITQAVRDLFVAASRAADRRRGGRGRRISLEQLFLEVTALPPHDTAVRLMRQLGTDPMQVRAAVVEQLRRSA